MKKCWHISYQFRRGRKKQLLRGEFCGCRPGETREEAIKLVSPIEVDADCTLVKITARRSKLDHYCYVNEASRA